jgi:hypothetical protein
LELPGQPQSFSSHGGHVQSRSARPPIPTFDPNPRRESNTSSNTASRSNLHASASRPSGSASRPSGSGAVSIARPQSARPSSGGSAPSRKRPQSAGPARSRSRESAATSSVPQVSAASASGDNGLGRAPLHPNLTQHRDGTTSLENATTAQAGHPPRLLRPHSAGVTRRRTSESESASAVLPPVPPSRPLSAGGSREVSRARVENPDSARARASIAEPVAHSERSNSLPQLRPRASGRSSSREHEAPQPRDREALLGHLRQHTKCTQARKEAIQHPQELNRHGREFFGPVPGWRRM